MDRALANKINDAALQALQAVADEFGVKLDRKGGSYSSTSLITKFEFADEGADQAEFDALCHVVGLTPEHFGKEFVSQGKRFVVTGINLRARKYPVTADCISDGKSYKFTADSVQRKVAL